jgi:Protein of unknown function (DUF1343)
MARLSRRGFIAASAVAGPVIAAGRAHAAAPAAPSVPGPGTGPGVVPAADILAAQGWSALAGRKVGVLTNPTGVLRDLTHIVDAMTDAGVKPVAAFGPEHGFRGTSQAGGS